MKHLGPISVLSFLQCVVVMFGMLSLRVWTKALGYEDGCEHITPHAVFLRQYGFVLFLIPLCFVLVFTIPKQESSFRRKLLTGCIILFILGTVFLMACFTAFKPITPLIDVTP